MRVAVSSKKCAMLNGRLNPLCCQTFKRPAAKKPSPLKGLGKSEVWFWLRTTDLL
jgi:hypothetical protein